jgi:hypothetical protein
MFLCRFFANSGSHAAALDLAKSFSVLTCPANPIDKYIADRAAIMTPEYSWNETLRSGGNRSQAFWNNWNDMGSAAEWHSRQNNYINICLVANDAYSRTRIDVGLTQHPNSFKFLYNPVGFGLFSPIKNQICDFGAAASWLLLLHFIKKHGNNNALNFTRVAQKLGSLHHSRGIPVLSQSSIAGIVMAEAAKPVIEAAFSAKT